MLNRTTEPIRRHTGSHGCRGYSSHANTIGWVHRATVKTSVLLALNLNLTRTTNRDAWNIATWRACRYARVWGERVNLAHLPHQVRRAGLHVVDRRVLAERCAARTHIQRYPSNQACKKNVHVHHMGRRNCAHHARQAGSADTNSRSRTCGRAHDARQYGAV